MALDDVQQLVAGQRLLGQQLRGRRVQGAAIGLQDVLRELQTVTKVINATVFTKTQNYISSGLIYGMWVAGHGRSRTSSGSMLARMPACLSMYATAWNNFDPGLG